MSTRKERRDRPAGVVDVRTPDAGSDAYFSPKTRPPFDDSRFMPGTIVDERYCIVSVLGRGSMGEVYRAADMKLGQEVALKFLSQGFEDDPERLELFLDEVWIARRITHPNVCRVYDVGEADGLHFISMEYIDGKDLKTLLKQVGRLPRDKAAAIGLELCRGLAAVHEQGILHRDLKPSNLLIDSDGQVRITDFGLAGAVGDPRSGGTPRYMAPERLVNQEASIRSDLYSLGLVLYELLTGEPPFAGSPLASLVKEPPPIAPRVEGLDPAVEVVILRCLERDPRDRPASAREVEAVLARHPEPVWRPAPGREIRHRPHWAIEKKLGEGGFGEVWLARHKKTGERRVFKFCTEAAKLKTLEREITLFRLLKKELHDRPDIARILDWSFDEVPYFIESEYASEGNLVDWAERRGGIGAVPLEERLEIVARLAEALAAAHSVGVLHKDVKPSNVLVVRDAAGNARVQLADFGVGALIEHERLAAAGITGLGLSDKSDTYPHGGTQVYMAPELLEGKPATVQADVYALGVILYQVVVGDFTRVLALGWQRDVGDELLAEDVAAAVEGAPERRLASAHQLARRLRSLPQRRAERDAEREVAAELERSRRRRRTTAAVGAGLAILTTASFFHSSRVAQEATKAKNIARVAVAEEWLAKDPTRAALVLLELDDPENTVFAVAKMREALAQELARRELRHPRLVAAAAPAPGGGRVAVVSEDGGAWLWSLDPRPDAARAEVPGGPLPLEGHAGPIRAAVWSPDDRRLATASEDGTVRLWDPDGTSTVLDGGGGPVRAAAWSPDGRRFATASEDGTVHLWDVGARTSIVLPRRGGPVTDAAWGPRGERLLLISGGAVQVWRVDGVPVLETELGAEVTVAVWSPDGRRLAAIPGLAGRVEVWDLDGSLPTLLRGHQGPIASVAWSADGERLVSASRDGTARVWRPGAAPLVLAGHQGSLSAARFDAHGRRVITASTDGSARVWDASTGRVLAVLKTNEGLLGAWFDPGGDAYLTVSRQGTLRTWDGSSSHKPVLFAGHEAAVQAVAWSPDGRLLVTGSVDGTVRLWDPAGGPARVVGGHRDVMQVTSVAWSAGGERIVAVYEDLAARSWPAEGPAEPVFFEEHLAATPVEGAPGFVRDVALSPRADLLVAASADGRVRVWHLDDPDAPPRVFAEHADAVVDVAVAPGGRRAVTASLDGTARVWRLDGDFAARTLEHDAAVRSAAWSPDGGRIATTSADGRVRVWDPDADPPAELAVLRHDDLVGAASWSPGGERLVTASWDGTVRVWPADGRGRPVDLDGHQGSVAAAAWSPDGRRVVTASWDGTARVWPADGSGEAIVLEHGGPVLAAAWSPDGGRVATASADGTVRLWPLGDPANLAATIRAATGVCLDPAFRVKHLGESPDDARRLSEACEYAQGR